MTIRVVPSAPATLLLAAALTLAANSALAATVAVADMPRYCQDQAAAKFKQNPSDVTTKAAEKNDGRYKVAGHYAKAGHKGDKFVCEFNKQGVFQGVKKKEED